MNAHSHLCLLISSFCQHLSAVLLAYRCILFCLPPCTKIRYCSGQRQLMSPFSSHFIWQAQPHSADQTSAQRVARKRQVRRRRTRTARPRPWSYHADWNGWDYYQPPLAYNGEHVSNEDMLPYDNETAVRKLTEFGENYERWINAIETDSAADELKRTYSWQKPPKCLTN